MSNQIDLNSRHYVLWCLSFVTLVRASIAPTPEESPYTSIKERLNSTFDLAAAVKSYCSHGGFSHAFLHKTDPIPVRPLAEFIGGETLINQGSGIHFNQTDYLELVDFTGRAIVQNKSGHIDNALPGILFRLSIRPKTWFENALNFEALYYKRFAPRYLLTG